jgi:hypothetical protein
VGLTTPPWKKLLSQNLKKQKASEELQGPDRVGEPMMIMIIIIIIIIMRRRRGMSRTADASARV